MTLLYTPAIWYIPVTGCLDQKSQDWGQHTIRYALYAHKGDWLLNGSLARLVSISLCAFSESPRESNQVR